MIKEFTVDFNKWGKGFLVAPLRSEGNNTTKPGNMCCLGFLGKACGVAKIDMNGLGLPANLDEDDAARFPPLDDDTFYQLAAINDGKAHNDVNYSKFSIVRRMTKITRIFADHGITVKWANVPKAKRVEFVKAVGKQHIAV